MRTLLTVIRRLGRGSRQTPSSMIWLIAAALLFVLGALANGAAGGRELTEIGVIGAVVAIAFVAAFMT